MFRLKSLASISSIDVHSRYGLHTRAVTVFSDTLTEGFSHFVTSIAAPVAPAGAVAGGSCSQSAALSRRTPVAAVGDPILLRLVRPAEQRQGTVGCQVCPGGAPAMSCLSRSYSLSGLGWICCCCSTGCSRGGS